LNYKNSSSDLQWLLLRNNSSFLIKRDGQIFNSEPFNLANRNTFKFSGLANKQAVGVDLDKKEKKIYLSTKKTKGDNPRRPRKLFSKAVLSKHQKNHTCRSAVAIRTLTQKSYYRADLAKFAIARYHALHRSLKVDTSKEPEKRKKRGRRAQKAAAAAAASTTSTSTSTSTETGTDKQ